MLIGQIVNLSPQADIFDMQLLRLRELLEYKVCEICTLPSIHSMAPQNEERIWLDPAYLKGFIKKKIFETLVEVAGVETELAK